MTCSATIGRRSQCIDIQIDKGSTFRETLTWKSGEAGSEVPVDLTGYDAKLQVRKNVESTTTLVELSVANSGITLNDQGEIAFYISATDSTAFDFSSAVYELEIYYPNGDTLRLLRGRFICFSETVR